MANPIQDVLPQHTTPKDNQPSSSTATLTRGGKITAYFTGKVVLTAMAIGLVIAIATAAFFHSRSGTGLFPGISFVLMVWGIATIAIVAVLEWTPHLFLTGKGKISFDRSVCA
jgi:hypothetical protein